MEYTDLPKPTLSYDSIAKPSAISYDGIAKPSNSRPRTINDLSLVASTINGLSAVADTIDGLTGTVSIYSDITKPT